MSEHLCVCGRPVQDAPMCVRCAHALDDHLAQVAEFHGLGWDLDIALSRQAVMSDRNGPRADTAPIPFDDRVSRVAAELKSTLSTWVRFVDEHLTPRPEGPYHRDCKHGSCELIRHRDLPADNVAACATWLRPRAGWLRHHPAGAEALDEIRDAVRAARRVIDRPADRLYAGPCQGCGTDLYARVGAVFVTCPNEVCGVTYGVDELRVWLLKSAEDILGTTTEISRALTSLAVPVTSSAIRGYTHRGQLLARGVNERGRPLYRVGDVQDCVARAAAVRSERIGA